MNTENAIGRRQSYYICEDADGWLLVYGCEATDTAVCDSVSDEDTHVGLIVFSGMTKDAAKNAMRDANSGCLVV